MDDTVLNHLIYQIANAPMRTYPYPHFYVEKAFPDEFYSELTANLPETAYYLNMTQTKNATSGAYQQRFLCPLEESHLGQLPFAHFLFWHKFSLAIKSNQWISALLEKFHEPIKQRFGTHFHAASFSPVAELIRDHSNYSIGPHTDLPIRVLTLLFYLPNSTHQSNLGTSIYRPINPTFECDGMTHHPFDNFTKVHTAPFLPNSIFGFVRSGRSFHGVELIQEQNVERNLMNYFLRCDT